MADTQKTQIASLIQGIKENKTAIAQKLADLTVTNAAADDNLAAIRANIEAINLVEIGNASLEFDENLSAQLKINEGYTHGGTVTIGGTVDNPTVTPSATEDLEVKSTAGAILGTVTITKVEVPSADQMLEGTSVSSNGTTFVTGTIAKKSAATYYPSKEVQSIAAGQYLDGVQSIAPVTVSASLDAANVKAGTVVQVGDEAHPESIAKVTGTFTSASTVSAGQTAATAADMLEGKSAWVNGEEVKGTITSKGAQTFEVSTSDRVIAADQYLSGAQVVKGVKISETLIAANLKHGVTVNVGDDGDEDRLVGVTGAFFNDGTTYTLDQAAFDSKDADGKVDMGAESSHRYIKTDGLQKTAVGTWTVDKAYSADAPKDVASIANVVVPEGSIAKQAAELVVVDGDNNDVFTQGTLKVSAGWVSAQTIDGATFSNTASDAVSYKDISDSPASPVLTQDGGFLYINEGYTDNVKISLAKLVPNEANIAKESSDKILQGFNAYDKDGNLIAGSMSTLQTHVFAPSAEDQTITAAGTYNATDLTIKKVVHNIDASKIPTGVTINIGSDDNATSVASINGTFGDDANVSAAQVLAGQVAYSLVNGELVPVTGTMANNAGEAGNITVSCLEVELNGAANGAVIPAGYYDGSSKVRLADDILTELASI